MGLQNILSPNLWPNSHQHYFWQNPLIKNTYDADIEEESDSKEKITYIYYLFKIHIFFDVTNFLNIFLRPTYFGYAKIILPFRNYSIFWTDSGRWCTVRARAPMNGSDAGHTIGITTMDAENRANWRCRRKRDPSFEPTWAWDAMLNYFIITIVTIPRYSRADWTYSYTAF